MWYKKKVWFYAGDKRDFIRGKVLSTLIACDIITVHGRKYIHFEVQNGEQFYNTYDCIIKNKSIYLVIYRGGTVFENTEYKVTIKSCGIKRR